MDLPESMEALPVKNALDPILCIKKKSERTEDVFLKFTLKRENSARNSPCPCD